MIDETKPLGARILERLRTERVIWMTTVDGSIPQPAPVWFLYERTDDGDRIIVYSKTGARRMANVMRNANVALNFNCSTEGGDVHVIRGIARVRLDLPQVPDYQPYMDRYRDLIESDDAWGKTFEGFAAQYSVPIEITELAIWGW